MIYVLLLSYLSFHALLRYITQTGTKLEKAIHPDGHNSDPSFLFILHLRTTQVHLLLTLKAVLFVIYSQVLWEDSFKPCRSVLYGAKKPKGTLDHLL